MDRRLIQMRIFFSYQHSIFLHILRKKYYFVCDNGRSRDIAARAKP